MLETVLCSASHFVFICAENVILSVAFNFHFSMDIGCVKLYTQMVINIKVYFVNEQKKVKVCLLGESKFAA